MISLPQEGIFKLMKKRRQETKEERFSLVIVNRISVLNMLQLGKISTLEASEQLALSCRQVLRLKKRFIVEGPGGLKHRGIGRKANNYLEKKKVELIKSTFDSWYSKTDVGINCSHLTDVLKREHGLIVSRQTVWRILRRDAKVVPCRRVKKHRLRRERSSREGELLFLDGSPHPWFGKDRGSATLLLCVDDATSKALHGLFVPQENLLGCLEVAYQVFLKYGLPMAFYLDRASQFKTTRKKYEEGTAPLTHWQKTMGRLGIRCIFAYSAQARGRGERMNGSFQGRLAAEFQYQKIFRLQAANRYLNEVFIPEYNNRFAVAPKVAENVWRKLTPEQDIASALASQQIRLVDKDNTFNFEGGHYQILPHDSRIPLAQTNIRVCLGLDGVVRADHPKIGPLQLKQLSQRSSKYSLGSIYKGVTF